MKVQPSISQYIYLSILAILGWFALIVQLYINLNSGIADHVELLIRYISYFTILTNLLVAICCTTLLWKPGNKFFSGQKTLTAITVYILIVGIIYNSILRFLWKPEGLQRLVDELLHTVIPIMFFIYWIAFVTKNKLNWHVIFPWLIFPLVYMIFVLVRGTSSGFYPYPFINADELGFKKVIFNAAGITMAFAAVSLVLVAICNRNRGFLHD